MTDHTEGSFVHPDLQPTRIKRDEEDVQAVIHLLETTWINPFNVSSDQLVSISTAIAAPNDVAKDLLEAKKKGTEAYDLFKHERLENSNVSFFEKITKLKLKTFADVGKKVTVNKGKSTEIILKADRNLFSQMILVAENRQLNLAEVLAYPLGPLPWALATADGALRKTSKAAVFHFIEKDFAPAEVIQGNNATVIDGMGLVQKLNGNDKTFSELAELALLYLLNESSTASRIDVVFDSYRAVSIKDLERSKRSKGQTLTFQNIAPGHRIQQWRKLLSSSANKENLIEFLVNEWQKPKNVEKLQQKVLFVTVGALCFKISSAGSVAVPDLSSTQEEADTRIWLHVAHAANSGHETIVIIAEDTDVLIIALSLLSKIRKGIKLYQKCGTKNRTRYLDLVNIHKGMGIETCHALIGMHAFTGCDTVSAFAGKGKIKVLKETMKDMEFQKTFGELGASWHMSPELVQQLQRVVCRIYMSSSKALNVNEMRYELFCAKRGQIDSSQLPPCQDCLFMHSMRANYQACIWRHALEANPDIPDPCLHGWVLEDAALSIEWMRGSPAPNAVLELLSCSCARVCKLPDCVCLRNSLKCTSMCKNQSCTNQADDEEVCDEPDDTDIEDDYEDD